MAIEIDGSMGEGGGQILRTALTLAMCLGEPVVIDNVRAGRRKPGLLRQHLAAVRAAKAICGAEVSGDELGSTRVEVRPGSIKGGDYEFAIGSAGSVTLLAQTILPALALSRQRSTIVMRGGTHNGMAPSVDFMERAFLPAMRQIGLRVHSHLELHGFHPNGGGCWRITVEPWLQPIAASLVERGAPVSRQAVAKLSNLQRHVAERELERVRKRLGWTDDEMVIEQVEAPGPGNIVSLRCEHERLTGVFESVGALGVPAERVAGLAIRQARHFAERSYAVCSHLADQLLVPMVLGAGGEFLTCELTEHMRTNVRVIEAMLGGSKVRMGEQTSSGGDGCTLVSVPEGWR